MAKLSVKTPSTVATAGTSTRGASAAETGASVSSAKAGSCIIWSAAVGSSSGFDSAESSAAVAASSACISSVRSVFEPSSALICAGRGSRGSGTGCDSSTDGGPSSGVADTAELGSAASAGKAGAEGAAEILIPFSLAASGPSIFPKDADIRGASRGGGILASVSSAFCSHPGNSSPASCRRR